jgi:ABC-type glycerol-3-phosphate transport system permease component
VSDFVKFLTKRQAKPRGFNYKPRYYDPAKENFKAMVERMREERDAIDRGEAPRINFKGAFTTQKNKQSQYRKSIAVSNIRLTVILILISLAAYFMYKSKTVNEKVNWLFKNMTTKNGQY